MTERTSTARSNAPAAAIRQASIDDETSLAMLWAVAFDGLLTPDQWMLDDHRLAHTLVAVDDSERLCGSIWGLPKRLRERDDAVADVHCIGSVAVAPHARGRGLSAALVSASLESADADWALLFTGTPDVYRSSGFETFEMRNRAAGPWRMPLSGMWRCGVTSEPLGASSFDGMHDVYERSARGSVLAPVRSDRDWAMAAVRLAGAQVHVARHDGAVQGYAVSRLEHREHTPAPAVTGVLCELAVVPTADPVVWNDLLSSVGLEWHDAGATACDVPAAHPSSAAEQAALHHFAPRARPVTDTTGMTRAIRRAPRLDHAGRFSAADYF